MFVALTLQLSLSFFFFFNDTAPTEIYTLSLHDALPIFPSLLQLTDTLSAFDRATGPVSALARDSINSAATNQERSEEHTSELQSRPHLVCRLLLEKKKKNRHNPTAQYSNDQRHHVNTVA